MSIGAIHCGRHGSEQLCATVGAQPPWRSDVCISLIERAMSPAVYGADAHSGEPPPGRRDLYRGLPSAILSGSATAHSSLGNMLGEQVIASFQSPPGG